MNQRLQPLNNPGNALPAAHTSSYHAIFFAQALQVVVYLNGKLGSGTAQRVAEANSNLTLIPGKIHYVQQLPVSQQPLKILYRLKATLPNGNEIFSKQLWLGTKGTLNAWLTPNALWVNSSRNLQAVRVTDVQGRLIEAVQGRQQSGTLTLALPASAGRLFVVHITDADGTSTTFKLFR